MKTTTKIIAGTIAAFSFVTASAVFAHPGMGQGQGMGQGMGMGMHGKMQHHATTADAVARLEAVKAELKITPAQEGAWQAFAGVTQQQAAAREAMRAQMQAQMQGQGQGATAAPADRSAHFESMAKFREEHMAARSAALKDLYAVLTPEQKLVADQQLGAMQGHRMAGRSPAR